MKNFLVNAAVCLISLLLFLALIEFSFQQNAVHKWVKFKAHQTDVSEVFPLDPLPPAVIEAGRKQFSSPNYDAVSWNALDARMEEVKYSVDPYPATFLIKKKRGEHNAVTIREEIKLGQDDFISTVYTMDGEHIRKSASRPYDKQKKNLLLLGCSIAFGMNLPDTETIPAHLAEAFPAMNVYNLGVPGDGITNILDDIYLNDRIANINKKGGAAIYIYFQGHFRRHFPGLEFFRRNSQPWSREYSVSNGQLVATEPGGLEKIEMLLLKWLSKSDFLYATGWGYNAFSRANQEMFRDYLVYIRDFYRTRYDMDFYLYVMNPDDLPSRWLYDELTARGIKVILHESLYNHFANFELLIPADGHPSNRGAYLISRLIEARLRRDGL